MLYNTEKSRALKVDYAHLIQRIQSQIQKFESIWHSGTDEEVFTELAFCIFTPQSKAKNCWKTVHILKDKNLLYSGKADEMSPHMNLVRFKNNKAKYLVFARELFFIDNKLSIKDKISELLREGNDRDWLVNNIKGYGYKEAGHFLRNIGANVNYAILDRHILKNLKAFGVINKIPESLTKKRYLNIESKMRSFAKDISIPICHLDLLFWYYETGEIFK